MKDYKVYADKENIPIDDFLLAQMEGRLNEDNNQHHYHHHGHSHSHRGHSHDHFENAGFILLAFFMLCLLIHLVNRSFFANIGALIIVGKLINLNCALDCLPSQMREFANIHEWVTRIKVNEMLQSERDQAIKKFTQTELRFFNIFLTIGNRIN